MKMIKTAVIILGIISISMIVCILCTSVIAGKRADESMERYFKKHKKG
jgi:c-di-GMP-related signal transduction protein